MLDIKITATALYFDSLTDELYTKLKKDFDLQEQQSGKGHCIKGSPAELFQVLYDLAYDYDIELS